MSFNNPTEFLPNLRGLPPQSQMMPSPFLKDLEPKVMTSFNFFKNIQPYRINNKSEIECLKIIMVRVLFLQLHYLL